MRLAYKKKCHQGCKSASALPVLQKGKGEGQLPLLSLRQDAPPGLE